METPEFSGENRETRGDIPRYIDEGFAIFDENSGVSADKHLFFVLLSVEIMNRF
jgi:hypothetical protein